MSFLTTSDPIKAPKAVAPDLPPPSPSLFPIAPPSNYNFSVSYVQTYTMLNPYDVTSSKDADPVLIEWASHVIMAVQSLKCCDMKIIVS